VKKSNLHLCNVLEIRSKARQLWQFSVSGNQIKLTGENAAPAEEPLPPKAAARSFLQRRLNIAWLLPDQVFLRVVHMPIVETSELISMIEFQLEKLSPYPVNQIVWSMEVLPHAPDDPRQAVVVIIAARDQVEEFLSQLEARNFLADQLELPQLHQLLTEELRDDGVWLYPTLEDGRVLCLIAWRNGSELQQVQLSHFTEGPGAVSSLTAQLSETAWAGEMEGWLQLPVRPHLVAEPELAAEWEPALAQWSGETVSVTAPPSRNALAELAARRAARGESKANLLPNEYAVRYRQQLVDRVWMSGLGALLGAYCAGVLVYFAILFFVGWQKDRVVQEVKALSGSYTNALEAKEKIEVLQNQLDLKYAALDAFKAVSDNLPTDFTLTDFNLSRGQKLTVIGTAPDGAFEAINEYVARLRSARVDGKEVFGEVPIPSSTQRRVGSSTLIQWNLNNIELKTAGGG